MDTKHSNMFSGNPGQALGHPAFGADFVPGLHLRPKESRFFESPTSFGSAGQSLGLDDPFVFDLPASTPYIPLLIVRR